MLSTVFIIRNKKSLHHSLCRPSRSDFVQFDFDGATLTEALKKTFENRGHSFTIEQFEQVMSFDNDKAMQKKWKAFVRKIDTKTDDYSTVLKTIKAFLTKPFTAAVRGKKFTEKWFATNGEWI